MDPLKPFASLVYSLRSARRSPETARTRKRPDSPSIERSSAESVRDRLRPRLQTIRPWNAERARRMFVECTLTSELGEEFSGDLKLAEIATAVSHALGQHRTSADRLDAVLRRLAETRT